MCNHCVIESVKRRMISRRGLFQGGAAALAAGAVTTPQPVLAQAAGGAVDLTHTYDEDFLRRGAGDHP